MRNLQVNQNAHSNTYSESFKFFQSYVQDVLYNSPCFICVLFSSNQSHPLQSTNIRLLQSVTQTNAKLIKNLNQNKAPASILKSRNSVFYVPQFFIAMFSKIPLDRFISPSRLLNEIYVAPDSGSQLQLTLLSAPRSIKRNFRVNFSSLN